MPQTAPFSAFERQIAWRYLRARRSEGGISVMSIISVLGIGLAVFALIATLAVRTGFRTELVSALLGANPHASIYAQQTVNAEGVTVSGFSDYDAMADRLAAVPGVTDASPVVTAQVMATAGQLNTGAQVIGARLEDLQGFPLVAEPERAMGELARLPEGIALGEGVARELGVTVGDVVTLISTGGVQTAFGQSIRSNAYEVVYVFRVGYAPIDRIRIYMPLAEAQYIFDKEERADQIELRVEDPESVNDMFEELYAAAGDRAYIWTWRDGSGGYLRALEVEDNVMFILMSILVLVAAMNIVSGLIMLVKNKGRDIGILRTIGLSEGSVLRVFFMCGALIGVAGTLVGVVLGCLFAIYIDPLFSLVNWLMGGGVWDPAVRGIYALPAQLVWTDVAKAVGLSLGLSFTITYFPARRAARMNPVEALRYE